MRLFVPYESWKRLTTLARVGKSFGEISGLGTIYAEQEQGVSSLLLDKIYLFQQTSSQTSTELETSFDATALGEFISKHIKESENLRFWWHTHPGGVFWSSIDEDTIEELGWTMPWLVSCVLNAKGEERWRFDLFYPARLWLDEIQRTVISDEDTKYEEKLKTELGKYIVKKAAGYSVSYWDPNKKRMVKKNFQDQGRGFFGDEEDNMLPAHYQGGPRGKKETDQTKIKGV